MIIGEVVIRKTDGGHTLECWAGEAGAYHHVAVSAGKRIALYLDGRELVAYTPLTLRQRFLRWLRA